MIRRTIRALFFVHGDVLGNTAATNSRLQQTYMASQLAANLRAISGAGRPTTPPPMDRKKA